MSTTCDGAPAPPDAASAPGLAAARCAVLLGYGDTALILGQRLAEWCGHGPVLEEDVALANIALDLLGQARLLLAHAGALEGRGRDADQLAFLRLEREYLNPTLAELPNVDFGHTALRLLLFGAFHVALWSAVQHGRDPQLATIAAKSLKEARYHRNHGADWTVRLGDGTAQSHDRMQRALDALWPYCSELFTASPAEQRLAAAGAGVDPAQLRPAWEADVLPVLAESNLRVPPPTPFRASGKRGIHSEHMGHLLAELQYLQRAFPGCRW